jgi:hypothetical protein
MSYHVHTKSLPCSLPLTQKSVNVRSSRGPEIASAAARLFEEALLATVQLQMPSTGPQGKHFGWCKSLNFPAFTGNSMP